MAYTPIGWQTGDTITAEKLNKMDNGWSVETTKQVCFDGTVTTSDRGGVNAGEITPESAIVADVAIVTFNGVEYTCHNNIGGGELEYEYGASYSEETGTMDFSTFPFSIYVSGTVVEVNTENAGTYTMKIEVTTKTAEVSDDYATSVRKVSRSDYVVTEAHDETYEETFTQAGGAATEVSWTVSADTINVNFDGTDYTCDKRDIESDVGYGASYNEETQAIDYSEYPFYIYSSPEEYTNITAETDGQHTIIVKARIEQSVQANQVFKKAIYSVVSVADFSVSGIIIATNTYYNAGRVTIPARSSVVVRLLSNNKASWEKCTDFIVKGISPDKTNARALNINGYGIESSLCDAVVQNISDTDVTLAIRDLTIDVIGFKPTTSFPIRYLVGE